MKQILEEFLDRGIKEGCFPGAQAACGRKDEVYALCVRGVKELGGSKVDADTLFDMASLTKLLAPTMIALKAIDAGVITLYDTLGYWFPDAPDDKKDITVFQLMTHTGGFEPSFRLDRMGIRPEDALKAILDSKLVSKPGEKVNYSCMGYITLGKLLEKAYGSDLKTLSDQMVFGPLGMTHTGYLPTSGNVAATEVDPETGKAVKGVVHDENARFLGGISANAGVFSNVGDMILFCRMLAGGGKGFVSPAVFKKATTCHTPNDPDSHRGLGFHMGGTEFNYMGDLFPACSFGHTGFTGTCIAVDPVTGFWAILLTNRVHPTRESFGLFRLRRALHNALYSEMSKNLL
ncbi:MAG: beta-lactamase family protein [Clostridiales bacterium]|nr:beta-lactamase family protein [Clostridiales bacterium]